VSEPDRPPPSLPDLVEEFFVVRAPRKESAHTVAAYRRDLSGVLAVMAANEQGPVPKRKGV
jgi:site-specific recombinase XerC